MIALGLYLLGWVMYLALMEAVGTGLSQGARMLVALLWPLTMIATVLVLVFNWIRELFTKT